MAFSNLYRNLVFVDETVLIPYEYGLYECFNRNQGPSQQYSLRSYLNQPTQEDKVSSFAHLTSQYSFMQTSAENSEVVPLEAMNTFILCHFIQTN